jgi:hypothetical protein
MKISEILAESKKLNKNAQDSIPDATSVGVGPGDSGPTNFYWKYRAGLAASFSPGENGEFTPGGPAHDDMVMIGYSKADQDIIDKAHKIMGWKKKKLSSRGSKESNDVHTTSPVNNWMKK